MIMHWSSKEALTEAKQFMFYSWVWGKDYADKIYILALDPLPTST